MDLSLFKIGNYKELVIEVPKKELTDEQLEDRVSAKLAELAESLANYVEVLRPAQMGDLVVFDYTGFCNGEQFEGGTAKDAQLLLGSGMFIEGFEEQLIGKNTKQICYVNVTFPEEYHAENLSGREACFMCTIHHVFEPSIPELDDEMAKRAGFENLGAMVAKAAEAVNDELEENIRYDIENALCPIIADLFEGEIPADMVDAQVEIHLQDFANTLQSQGMNLHDFLNEVNLTTDALRTNYRSSAESICRLNLALLMIAEKEGFSVTPEEMEEEYRQLGIAYSLTPDDTHALIGEEELHKELLNQKVLDFLREVSTINYV